MPSVKGSLTNFIVKPSTIAYQRNQNNNVGGTIGNIGYTMPNEAYGTPSGAIKWYVNSSKTTDMSTMPSKTGYDAWKYDYIWLPSLTETGRDEKVNGIWALSDSQRSNSIASWLRSASFGYANTCCYLQPNGTNNYKNVNDNYAVRPALHLNLDLVEA